jgi:sec-independent protein translocase protein TatA
MNIFGLGPLELGLILLVVVILFGPKSLPKVGASVGKTMKAFREGSEGKADDDGSATEPAAAVADDTEADEE